MRIGGGYLHAREFINLYTDQEANKIERNNVLSKYESKMEIQRIAANLSTRSVERRPIRGRSISYGIRQDDIMRPLRSANLRLHMSNRR